MRLLGLDLSSRACGWCAGDERTTPQADAILLPQVGADLGMMGEIYLYGLRALLRRFTPELIMIEAPLKLPTDKLLTLRKLYGLGVLTMTEARAHGIPYYEADCQDLKKELTGKRNAIKADMVFIAQKVGIVLPLDLHKGREDAADAFAAWRLAQRLHGDMRVSAEWDRRIYGGRGSALF
jgi:Holliday junction resolvasome RuvABC endonuclease subunit